MEPQTADSVVADIFQRLESGLVNKAIGAET